MIFVFIFRSVYCSSIHSLSIISREREVQQCTTWVLNTQPHKTASSKNFWRSKGFCSSCTGQERVTGATSQPASLTSTSTPSYVSLAIVSADNLSFRLDQLPRSLVCIIVNVSKLHQKFQTDKSHLSFFQIDRKIELCRNYIKVLDNLIYKGIFENYFQIFSVLEPGFRLWRGRWVYWQTNWFRDRYEKSNSNTVFDTVAKLSSANCQIAESIVLQNNCKHDQLQCVQGAGGVARTAWSRCQSGHGGGQAEQGC